MVTQGGKVQVEGTEHPGVGRDAKILSRAPRASTVAEGVKSDRQVG